MTDKFSDCIAVVVSEICDESEESKKDRTKIEIHPVLVLHIQFWLLNLAYYNENNRRCDRFFGLFLCNQ